MEHSSILLNSSLDLGFCLRYRFSGTYLNSSSLYVQSLAQMSRNLRSYKWLLLFHEIIGMKPSYCFLIFLTSHLNVPKFRFPLPSKRILGSLTKVTNDYNLSSFRRWVNLIFVGTIDCTMKLSIIADARRLLGKEP